MDGDLDQLSKALPTLGFLILGEQMEAEAHNDQNHTEMTFYTSTYNRVHTFTEHIVGTQ